jgi:predicted dehydrogenase/threonine dehydrogenase-like Zn-dependent dehydrogenase
LELHVEICSSRSLEKYNLLWKILFSMKQLILSPRDGTICLVEVPIPLCKSGELLIRNTISLVSVGTEKYMLQMARKSLVSKAMARPDLVKQVITKVKAEGFLEAYKTSMARLSGLVPLGYSTAGVVIDVGEKVKGFTKGDRVACAGSPYASHAEIVYVPENFLVKIPDKVDFESASFAALGGTALQAVRLARPTLGDRVVVIGLGLLGQITVQLLKSAGCHVFGTDISEEKVDMAVKYGTEKGAVFGKEDVTPAAREFAPDGFDSVIIMAAAKTNEPLELAAEIARGRARIVATGLVGLEVPRKIFFEKELELVVSRAWGPGVFDPLYSEKNIDYPYAYTRWTAKRNLEEFIYQLSNGSVKVKHLVTHRFPIEKAVEAYDLIFKAKEPHIGVVIEYPGSSDSLSVPGYQLREKKISLRTDQRVTDSVTRPTPCIGVIGAGLFATGTLLPILKSSKDVRLKGVVTATGLKGQHVAKKNGFEYFTTDYKELLKDNEIDLIFILTRHGSHAHFVIESLKTNKNIFVEKPLCINEKQLKKIVSTYQSLIANNQSPILMVGFNRRFSPFSIWLKEKFKAINEPLSIHCTVNAGYVPPEHWVHDPEDGGGRIVGEVCHFVDLIQYLTGSLPVNVFAEALSSETYKPSDNVVITLKMANGALGSITYVAGGDRRYPKERLEVFGGGAVGFIGNFSTASFTYGGRTKRIRKWLSVDRGHRGEIEALFNAEREGIAAPVDLNEYIYTTLATFAMEESLRTRTPVMVDPAPLFGQSQSDKPATTGSN